MNEKEIYCIFDDREPPAIRIVRLFVAYSFLAFFIWLSDGSKFWTFITGSLFIFGVCSYFLARFRETKRTFRSKEDLQKWVDAL